MTRGESGSRAIHDDTDERRVDTSAAELRA
jgi:hypothetical protein